MTKQDIFSFLAVHEDGKTLRLARRYKDYNSIRRDLRDAHRIIDSIIEIQQHIISEQKELDLSVLEITRANLLYAILAYTRWFKQTNNRVQLHKKDFFIDNSSGESKKHDELIDLRDTYIAHPETDILGGDQIWVEYNAGTDIQISSTFCIQIWDKPDTLKLIRRCIETVHNKIDGKILPDIESHLKNGIQKLLQY